MKFYLQMYSELSKSRIVFMVLVTHIIGFLAASPHDLDWPLLFWTTLATYLLASGSSVLNHYMERDVDSLMIRTHNRPLPQKKIEPSSALLLGLLLLFSGAYLFKTHSNTLTTFLALFAAFVYNLVYTPMKKKSWLNTFIGSIPGALPPLWGWTSVTNHIHCEGVILFLILLSWQHPHFFAIAWMMKDDYKRAGLKMLPVVDTTGQKTFLYILLFALILIPLSLLPVAMKMTGTFYFYGTFFLSFCFFILSVLMSSNPSDKSARSVLLGSVLYLPLLLIILIGDRFL